MPFISRRFRTDGRKVFIELVQRLPDNDEPAVPRRDRELIEVLTGQQAFADVVEPSLFADVEWQNDLASRWWPLGPDCSVIIDPGVLFGAPRLANTSVPTAAVAASMKAEGGGDAAAAAVADWYGVPVQGVWDAMKFETEWLSRAA